ncbi:Uncharacterised protein [Streptococcus acidominimus]|uniref:Bacteriocin n=1 Tax=Streptococcus acidominimus TaxID=1326 RepID=A0A239XL08_STRAI|nr:hypothetical protein [Streptococcus acidominimus]SNV47669.1 Uncharacterised protein [Streptococcus acidominimus]
MTTSIKDFAKNFQVLNSAQLKAVIGGNGGIVQPLSIDRRKKKFG